VPQQIAQHDLFATNCNFENLLWSPVLNFSLYFRDLEYHPHYASWWVITGETKSFVDGFRVWQMVEKNGPR
jgi:hypothetical protein